MDILRLIAVVWLLCIAFCSVSYAQFSPGELSRAHEALEGTSNCTQCHDVGEEISGKKCTVCHTEITKQFDIKRGFHFLNGSSTCVSCHKEHLGKDAQTYKFDSKSFDHGKTGFALTGAHRKTQCEKCHTGGLIKNEEVLKKLKGFSHQTYLGLETACRGCHNDVHKGKFTPDCNTCHTTSAWKPASSFDHAKTAFKLEGGHAKVLCTQCHTSLSLQNTNVVEFMTKSFSDCTPCHKTPHGEKFEGKQCKSCHTAESWGAGMKKAFDHSLTAYRLEGKHLQVKCEGCHRTVKKGGKAKVLKVAYKECTDCHVDFHKGEFKTNYKNDCSQCHNEYGFIPSLYTLAKHSNSEFPLIGAHSAVMCSACHREAEKKELKFHFDVMTCESCHKNPHGKNEGHSSMPATCEKCHSTTEWKNTSFDHSATKFSLTGKHSTIHCKECHTAKSKENVITFSSAKQRCESCHREIHGKQFAQNGETDCAVCHKPESWKMLIFNHESQSKFSLRGAHAKVECKFCHKTESMMIESTPTQVTRYKPLSNTCESCHMNMKER